MNFFFLIRLLIGLIFVVSGFQKVSTPYQNFLFIIQQYEIVSDSVAIATARVLPWIELIVGVFLILGFWLREVATAAAIMFVMFIVVVSQALLRGIDLSECGCFGELVSMPPQGTLVLDVCLLTMTIWLILRREKAGWMGLDGKFNK